MYEHILGARCSILPFSFLACFLNWPVLCPIEQFCTCCSNWIWFWFHIPLSLHHQLPIPRSLWDPLQDIFVGSHHPQLPLCNPLWDIRARLFCQIPSSLSDPSEEVWVWYTSVSVKSAWLKNFWIKQYCQGSWMLIFRRIICSDVNIPPLSMLSQNVTLSLKLAKIVQSIQLSRIV